LAEDSAPHKKDGRQGEGGGPRPKPIDPEQIMMLASIQCTYEEIAAVVKLKKRQFIDRVNADQELREAIEAGWANGRASLRRQQYKLFMGGNATMGIWLGKQYLGQRDQAEIKVERRGDFSLEDLLIHERRLRDKKK
jgi:hypothetical protein